MIIFILFTYQARRKQVIHIYIKVIDFVIFGVKQFLLSELSSKRMVPLTFQLTAIIIGDLVSRRTTHILISDLESGHKKLIQLE